MVVSGRIAKEEVFVVSCLVVEFHLNCVLVAGVPLSKVRVASSVSAVALSELINQSLEVVDPPVTVPDIFVKFPVSPYMVAHLLDEEPIS